MTATATRPLKNMTAADLMTENPLSVREVATTSEATRFLTEKGISAAAVIDEAGRPVGVLSATDLLIHQRESVCDTLVSAVMTPIVFSARTDEPATAVVERMVSLNVHRLFVLDESGVVVGVISAFDVMRHLIG